MQIIESSAIGVRSAVYTLRRADGPLTFVLFPMIHVGSREYFVEIERRLRDCDVIFAEGIRSRRVDYITWSYTVVNHMRGLGLVTQHSIDLRQFGPKVVNTDMPGREFDAAWGRIGRYARLVLWVFVPFYVMWFFVFGTKAFLAHYLEMDDLPSRRDVLSYGGQFEGFEDLVLTQRDKLLVQQIVRFHELHRSESKVVAILYGAGHMPAVLTVLQGKLNYRVAKAEWVTVFSY
jgi:hypothetical protein